MAGTEEVKRRQENLKLLGDEAESREKRIKMRKQQREKADAKRRIAKRKRMFKVAGVWIGIIFVGFFITAWFSKDFVHWFHEIIN